MSTGSASRPFDIGLNPYGLAYTVGLQGWGTPRVNPQPLGLDGFIALARELNMRCVELDWRWLTPLSADALARVRSALDGTFTVYSYWLSHEAGETLIDAVTRAQAIGARIFRMHLTPVLEGGRAAWGERWPEMVAHAREVLRREASRVEAAGLTLAIENHQDFGSEELLDFVEELGEGPGLVLDTGNPFSVGEDPVAFARRAAHRIRHVHLKDYLAQFTDEGYRLVRCAIGDGCVPFQKVAAALERPVPLTASIEPGALESRHIRLFTREWWNGYPPRDAREFGVMLGRLRKNRLKDDADSRTPWERDAPGELIGYEVGQVHRSIENLRELGWISR